LPLKRNQQKLLSFTAPEAAGFRLQRHHLLAAKSKPSDVVSICRDICGAQAQLTTAAHLQLWSRNHALRRTDVESALWQDRSLVKSHMMRQTLHLVPADDFALYVAALKSCRVADALRIMRRFGISDEEGHSLTPLILDALTHGPLRRAEVTAAVRPKVSKRVQAWMARVWSIVRVPMAEGKVCYGSGEGNEVTLIRTDHWLKQQPAVEEEAARAELFRRYLRAYGPATLRDFAHWAGLPAPQVRPLQEALQDGVCEVSVDGNPCLLLRADLSSLEKAKTFSGSVRLLPHFDPYLLAHRAKDHLLASSHYKRVYRNQGWISPVVLLDGEIAAVWSYKAKGRKLEVSVEPFRRFTRAVRERVTEEAEALAEFFNSSLEVEFMQAA